MRLEIEVLDGPQKGKRIALKKGLVIGKKTGPLTFSDELIAENHGVFVFDQKNSWIIECLAPNTVRIGLTEQARASLLIDLVFHLGQTGFKVVEKQTLPYETWESGTREWLKHHPGNVIVKDYFFFLRPVSLSFIQGPQYEEFITLSYGPRFLGHDSLDISLKDPACPKKVAQFFQVGDQAYLQNLCGDQALVNSTKFDQHPIQDGDLLKINSTIIELSFQK